MGGVFRATANVGHVNAVPAPSIRSLLLAFHFAAFHLAAWFAPAFQTVDFDHQVLPR